MLINKYTIKGKIAYIELTQGQVTKIDVEDLDRVLQYRWLASYNTTVRKYYVITRINGKTTYLHRFLMNAPRGVTVDHIKHDTLDNRKKKLRLVTNQKNCENRNGHYTTSKTGIRGVSTHKCKPSGLMYVFRCHCVNCKIAHYFPHTKEGLEEARKLSEAHFAQLKP